MMRKMFSPLTRRPLSGSIRMFADKKKKNPCSLCPDENEQRQQEKRSNLKEDEPMCKHHGDMVPEAKDLKNLKNFELMSNCNKFHWKSEGQDC